MLLINVLEAIHRGVHLPPTLLQILCVRYVCAMTDVTGDDWNITSDFTSLWRVSVRRTLSVCDKSSNRKRSWREKSKIFHRGTSDLVIQWASYEMWIHMIVFADIWNGWITLCCSLLDLMTALISIWIKKNSSVKQEMPLYFPVAHSMRFFQGTNSSLWPPRSPALQSTAHTNTHTQVSRVVLNRWNGDPLVCEVDWVSHYVTFTTV